MDKKIFLILILIFLVGCVPKDLMLRDLVDEKFLCREPEQEQMLKVRGFSKTVTCGEKCSQEFSTAWGKTTGFWANRGDSISWQTDDIPNNVDSVTFVWRGAQYGDGVINWYVDNKYIMTTKALSRSYEQTSKNYTLKYDYLGLDSGIFSLNLPRSEIKDKATITAEMIGEEYIMVDASMLSIVFRENSTFALVYGFDNVTYCKSGYCDNVYDSAWGATEIIYSKSGDHISWATANVSEGGEEYAVFYFRATHYGNCDIDWYLNSKKIITSRSVDHDASWVGEGYRLYFDYEDFIDGYSGTYYLWVPRAFLKKGISEISAYPRGGWIAVQKLSESDFNLIGENSFVELDGYKELIYCIGYCDDNYPALDGRVKHFWASKGEHISWKSEPVAYNNVSYVVFSWEGSQYGNGQIDWYLNNQKILTSHATGRNTTWVNDLYRLQFVYTGYAGGYVGNFRLWVPASYIEQDKPVEISAYMIGHGWVMVRKE